MRSLRRARLILFFVLFVFVGFASLAQTSYYSIGSFNNPTTASNWRSNRDGTGTSPSSTNISNIILIVQNGHTVTCTTSAMSVTKGSSRIRLETGGIFTTNQNNNVDIELQGGRWIQSGSYAQTDFFGAGVNTLASIFELSTASNFRFFTYPVSVLLSGGTLSCGNNDLDVDGDLTIGSGVTLNGTATNNPTHNIAGSINVAGGTFNLATAGGSPSFTISGSINLISGTVQHSGTGTATITFGATSGTDTLGMSTGTFRVNINCAASQTSVISAGTITHSAGTFSTGNSSTVQLGSSQFSGAAALTVGTSVTLETAHADGFDNGASGCLNYSGTVTLPASTTFRYVGSSAQSTGLSGYGTLTNTVSNIVVATTGSTTVTLDKTLTISGNLTVNTGQTLSYASQTLTLTGSLTLNGTLSDNATSLLVLNNGVSNTFPNGLTALSGGLTLNGALTSLALNASSLSIGAAFTFTNGTFDISGKSLTLNGAITLTAGTLTTSSTTDISIGGSGTLTLGAVATPANLNNLTVNRTGLNLILSQNLTIAGSATITAGTLTYSSRTLTIQNGLSGAGVIADNSTSTLTISNAPSVTIPTGTTTLNGALSISGTSAAVGIGASSLTVSGTFTMSAGSFDIASKTLNLNGILNLTGGSLATNGSTTLAIGGSGTTTWTGVTFPSVIGTLNLNRSGFTLNLASNLTVNTALSIATGNTFVYSGYTLTINGTFTLNGTLTENASSILVISTGGSITLPNAITSLNGGLTISGALTNLSLSSSSLTVSSGFTITGGIFTISTRTINLNGAITLSGGTITGNASTTLNIGGSGTISGSSTALSTLGTLSINRAGQTWNMGGALTVSASTTITAGSLNLNGNTLTLTGDISFGATGITSTNTASAISISGTGTFTGTLGDIALNTLGFNRSGATLNQNGRMRLAGNYTLTAGTHNCSGTANTIEFGSGATSSGTFSAANSNISILGTGTFGISLGAITLNKLRINRASFTLSTSGNTTISDSLKVENGTFAVAAGHTLTLSGPVNVVGTLSFNSTSSLTIDGSGAIIGLSLPTTLSGYTINRSTASITQTSNLTLTGTIAFTSGTHNIGANTLIIQGNVTFGSGTLNSLSTSNITLSSTGTITGSINITAVNNLTMNRASRTLTLGSNLVVSGTLTLTNGTFDISNRSLTLNGDYNDAGGNFTANSSTNLTIGGSGAIDDFNDFTALNNLTMNRASTTANFPTTLTISGTLTLSNGTVECDDLTLNGPWTITSGSLLIDASKSLTIGGSGALPSTWSNGSDIDNLTINRAGATLVTSNSLTVSGTYTVSAGTHSYVGTNLSLNGPISFSGGAYDGGTTGSIVINGSGTITGSAQFRRIFNFSLMRPSATISLTGLNIISGGFSSSSGTTINMNNTTARFSGNITVSGTWNITSNTSLLVDGTGVITGFPNGFTTIDSLRFNRSTFTHTPSVDFTVNGAFELNAGTIDLTTRALTLNGPITYSGGTLVTNSFSNISIGGSGTISGFPSFSNINTININRSGQTINLASNLNVDAGLTTTAGFINSGTYTITLSNTAVVIDESTTGRVFGTIQTTRSVGTGSSTFGDLGFEIAAGTQNIGSVTVVRKTGPGNAVVAVGNESINAQFNISITGSQPTSGRVITLKWLSLDNNSKDFTTGYGDVWRRNDLVSPWVKIANNQAYTLSSGVYTIQAVTTHFSDFTVTDDASPLPVDLAFFKAERVGEKALLTWQTRSEVNNTGFRIEESLNNKSFTKAGFVDGKGNESYTNQYSFFRHQPLAAYYRITQIDADGAETVYGPVYLPSSQEVVEVQLYPNPASDVVVVKGLAANTEVEISDAQGRLVQKSMLSSSGLLNIASLPKGIYFCKFNNHTGTTIRQLTK